MNGTAEENNATVAQAWGELRPLLAQHNGTMAAQMMERLFEQDKRLWNGVYWKADKWFVDWFRSRMPVDANFPKDDFAQEDWAHWHDGLGLGKQGAQWKASDLPYILQELKALEPELKIKRDNSAQNEQPF
jgi:hypothetical protein